MREVKPANHRTRVITEIPEDAKTRTVQSEAKHADINNIVAKAMKTGQLPVLVSREPLPVMPEAQTYLEMMNKVVFAQQAFERLPVTIRNHFHNKPENLLDAIGQSKDNEGIKKQLQSFGILETPPPPPEEPPAAPKTQGEAAPAA